MTSAILTSDRYIAIVDKSGNVVFNGIVRILSKDGLVTPARWNPAHKRLESVALNRPAAAAQKACDRILPSDTQAEGAAD
jgi:hypothetical protein